MTKKIFLGLALLAALVSCNKEFTPATTTEDQGKTLVIGASLDPLTKMDYTAQEDGSYKATFLTNGNDALYAYFVKEASGTKTALGRPVKLSIDMTTLSADKRSASFVAKSAVIPEGATHIYTYFANGGTNTAYVDSVLVDLSAQNGFANANSNHLISAVSPISELKEGENEYNLQSISLKYQTALVKFVLTLPEGDTLNVGAATPIEIEGAGIHDTLSVFGKAGDFTKLGKITLIPEEKEKATVVTAYGVVFASDNFAGSSIKLWDGDDSYVAEFAPSATLEAGKSYTAARTLKKGAFATEKWVADEAGSFDWTTTGVTSDAEWLTFADNKLSWAANTTGKVREGKAKDANGNEYTITQIGPNEFAGAWTFNAKVFAPNANLGRAAGTYDVNLTISVQEGTTASEGEKSITNNLAVTGLINTYVAEAVADIDYENKTWRFGFFFNGKKAQAVSTGNPSFGYVTMLPELGVGWGTYNFCPVPFNNSTNYGWLWFVVDDLETMHYGPNDWYKMDGKDLLGISFCACSKEEPAATDYAQDVNAGKYDVIFQCNPTTDPGFLLKKK
jgi:hypothetical protein